MKNKYNNSKYKILNTFVCMFWSFVISVLEFVCNLLFVIWNLRRSLMFTITIILFFISFSFPTIVNAARLYFETGKTEVGIGQETEITLYVDSDEKTINALEGEINIPNYLSVESIRDGDSIIAFWGERPYLQNNQKIIFSGVVPGGWKGSKAKLFSIIAKTKNEGTGTFSISNAKVLLNDGKGTETLVSTESLSFSIDETIALTPTIFDYEDDESPELFIPSIVQDPDIFENDYFLVFVAQDKGSGIDYYEALETKKILKDEEVGVWQRTESPYRIIDQTLKSFIYIRAIDRAGNSQIALIEPEKPTRDSIPIIIFIVLVIVITFLYILRKKIKK